MIGELSAESLVSMVHVPGEEAHGEDFEEEIHGGQIDQTEEEEPEGTEVECEQAVQEDNGQRLLTERLAQLCGDVAGHEDRISHADVP